MAEEDGALAEQEKELTKEVPSLLETMNRTSSEVNIFERQASEAQARYKKLLEQWSRVYEELRAHYGASIDRVKPYFEAAQNFRYASERVQVVVRAFSAAASQHSQAKAELRSIETRLAYGAHKVRLDRDQQDGLSRATVRVLRCRQERDRREQEYAESLREYEDAKASVEELKHKLGEALIKRYEPIFRQLQQHQLTLSAEQQRIACFAEKAAAAKNIYNKSLAELDRINVAVHDARRESKQKALAEEPKEQAEAEEPEVPEVTRSTAEEVFY